MFRNKNKISKQRSRFICLQCERENFVGMAIQRPIQREKYHIKDLYCIYCRETTKNVEVRSCDQYEKVYQQVPYIQKRLKMKKKEVDKKLSNNMGVS